MKKQECFASVSRPWLLAFFSCFRGWALQKSHTWPCKLCAHKAQAPTILRNPPKAQHPQPSPGGWLLATGPLASPAPSTRLFSDRSLSGSWSLPCYYNFSVGHTEAFEVKQPAWPLPVVSTTSERRGPGQPSRAPFCLLGPCLRPRRHFKLEEFGSALPSVSDKSPLQHRSILDTSAFSHPTGWSLRGHDICQQHWPPWDMSSPTALCLDSLRENMPWGEKDNRAWLEEQSLASCLPQ